jgi:hypothetical protein
MKIAIQDHTTFRRLACYIANIQTNISQSIIYFNISFQVDGLSVRKSPVDAC